MYPKEYGVECYALTESSQTVTPLKDSNPSDLLNTAEEVIDGPDDSTPALSRTHLNQHEHEINSDNDNQSTT